MEKKRNTLMDFIIGQRIWIDFFGRFDWICCCCCCWWTIYRWIGL